METPLFLNLNLCNFSEFYRVHFFDDEWIVKIGLTCCNTFAVVCREVGCVGSVGFWTGWSELGNIGPGAVRGQFCEGVVSGSGLALGASGFGVRGFGVQGLRQWGPLEVGRVWRSPLVGLFRP